MTVNGTKSDAHEVVNETRTDTAIGTVTGIEAEIATDTVIEIETEIEIEIETDVVRDPDQSRDGVRIVQVVEIGADVIRVVRQRAAPAALSGKKRPN